MKSFKQTAVILLSVLMLGSMTACSKGDHINDATKGSSTGETLDEDIKNGADKLEDGAENIKDDVEDGAEDIKDGVEDALDGNGRTDMNR